MCALLALVACTGNGNGNGANTTPGPTSTSSATPQGTEARITIKGFNFMPADLKVRPGEKITVSNFDSAPHTVTAKEGSAFDTGNIEGGQSATFTAPSKPGSYPFFCSLHPRMTATLTVG
ncbi:cupredoxin domain-containing protein [Streptomyces sp. DSM 116496]|uniref:cupredoxin domain-containing protein n=1 Tax=Streptomyces stoeckheimensis TaxID=3344656 RepID=UPI0038B3A86A